MKASKFWVLIFFFILLLLAFSDEKQPSVLAQSPDSEIYVANNSSQCSGKSQCFFNDDPDTIDSIALAKAIDFAKDNNLENANIHILSPYSIKSDQIIIDYPVSIIGENGGWLDTSIKSNCNKPMFLIQAEVQFQNLHITDGSCSNPSRDLIHVESNAEVRIQNSTLEYGKNAIVHKTSTGKLVVQFCEIKNNDQHALLSENTEATSELVLIANNIIDNQDDVQVLCSTNTSADHNFWGDNILPSQASQTCGVDDLKVLGARIHSLQTGVAAALLTLNATYPSSDFYGLSARSDEQTQLYVINHQTSMPFADSSARNVTACGNYFDIFLPEDAEPQQISLRLTYDKSEACTQAVQTMSVCGSGQPKTFPLMWYDPKTGVTDGWDYAGDSPQSEAGNIFAGQQVACDFDTKEIEIFLDNDGRPNLLNDLHYTPMVVGFEVSAIYGFSVNENSFGTVSVNWATRSEVNTSDFRVLRANTGEGPWTQISTTVAAAGAELQSHSYQLNDDSIDPVSVYYYKVEALFEDGSLQQSIGPIQINTISPTSTVKPSSTPYPTRTLRPTSTPVPTRTPTPFTTATNSFRTFTPTFVTNTPRATTTVLVTDTPTLAEFEKPTSLRPTETIRPTSKPGNILEKKKDTNPDLNSLLVWGSILVVGVGTVIAIYLSKKSR